MIAPFKYSTQRQRARPKETGRIRRRATDEGLTGFIGGLKASDIEERFARSLSKYKLEYTFRQHYFGPARTTPGAIEVDFMVNLGATWVPASLIILTKRGGNNTKLGYFDLNKWAIFR